MWVLAVTLAGGDLFHFPLPPGLATVGRSEANSIRLTDETVSSAHAELVELSPGKYRVRDLGSTNGTFVNGSVVTEIEISAPCTVTFGSVQCQLALSSAPIASRPSLESAGHQRAIDALTKENNELKLARSEVLETLALTRSEVADQRAALAQQLEQAAADARNESASTKQALDEATAKLASQEQEYKREVIAAVEAERKESERLASEHGAQLTRLAAEGETQRLHAEELLGQTARAREEIERLAAIIEQSNTTIIEEGQAFRDAENESGLLKKELHDLKMHRDSQEVDFKQKLESVEIRRKAELEAQAQQAEQTAQNAARESASLKQALDEATARLALQEQEHKQALAASLDDERKKRENIDRDHALLLTKLEAVNETDRLRTQDLLTQHAKAREEIEQLARIAEQSKVAVGEKERALRDAEVAIRSLEQALEDLTSHLVSQERDFKQKLDAAEAKQQGERDRSGPGHADQLTESQTLTEIQQREAQELHDQIEALRKKHPRAIERLESTHHADLVTIHEGHEKPVSEITDQARHDHAGKDRPKPEPGSHFESPSYNQHKPQHSKQDRAPHSDQSIASKPSKLTSVLNALPAGVRPPSAAMVTRYLLTFVLGYLLSTVAPKHDTHPKPAPGVPTQKLVTTEEPAATAPSTPSSDPSAPLLATVKAEPIEAIEQTGKPGPGESAPIDSQPPVIPAEGRSDGQRPPWMAGYQLAGTLLARSAGANPLFLLGAQWEAENEPRETGPEINHPSTIPDQSTIESSRSLGGADESSVALENPGTDAQPAGAGLKNTTTDPDQRLQPLSPTILDRLPQDESGQAPSISQAAFQTDPLWMVTGSESQFAAGNIGADWKDDYVNGVAFDDGKESPLFNLDMTALGLSSKSLAGVPGQLAGDPFDLASLSLPAVGRQSRGLQVTPSGTIFEPKAAPAPTPLTVMILGDSMSLCGFGKRLDDQFRVLPQVKNTFTYMASGTNPLSWLKDKPYTNARTRSGFWSIETVPGKGNPKVVQDTYGMKRGSVPKSHPVPKLEDLLSTNQPDILIVQNGTNLFDLFRDGRTVQPKRQEPLLKHYIEPFIARLLSPTSPLRKIYWVSSPTSGRVSKEIQDFVFDQLSHLAGDAVTVIDSRQLISYPYRNMAPDREHFVGNDMDRWADKVYEIIQKDLASQSLATLRPLHALPSGSAQAGSNSVNGKSKETNLVVSATLTFKSEPLNVKALLPYQDSLVAYVYAIQQVLEGEYAEKEILVMHPAHIGLKPQSLKTYRIGKTYNLRLRELETTQWSTVKSKDDSGTIELTPYIRVEDDIRILEHGHGAVSAAH